MKAALYYSGDHSGATPRREHGHPCPHERRRREDSVTLYLKVEKKRMTSSVLWQASGQGCPRSQLRVAFMSTPL
jgi:hypothetical protein